jgi:hypothetical protein
MKSRDEEAELHRAVPIVRAILAPLLDENGGDEMDVLLLLESVVTGVLSVIVKLGGDEPVLDKFIEGVRQRMAEIRLGDLPTDDPQ